MQEFPSRSILDTPTPTESCMSQVLVPILRTQCDSTNLGVSSPTRAYRGYAIVLSEDEPCGEREQDMYDKGYAILRLQDQSKRLGPAFSGFVVVPAIGGLGRDGKMIGPMNGGNYVGGRDSMWKKLVGHDSPIPIHDRYETQKMYSMMD